MSRKTADKMFVSQKAQNFQIMIRAIYREVRKYEQL